METISCPPMSVREKQCSRSCWAIRSSFVRDN